MPNQVTITNVFGLTPPFSAYCCNVYGNQCVYVGSGVMPPITITLPPQFNTAPAVGLLLIDSIGCERFEEIYCTPPTPSPTQTPTPTPTPTPTETPTPTPTPTPIPCDTYWFFDGGFAGATFDYTDCDGFLQILPVGIGSFEYRCGYLLPGPTLISGSGSFSDSGPCQP